MKTKTLLMVTGAGALVYLLWKKNNAKPKGEIYYSRDKLGMPIVKDDRTLKMECESSGGTWVQPHCAVAPCRGICVK